MYEFVSLLKLILGKTNDNISREKMAKLTEAPQKRKNNQQPNENKPP